MSIHTLMTAEHCVKRTNGNGDTPGRRILVVDDNPEIHKDFRKILGRHADNGATRLETLLFGKSFGHKVLVPEYEIHSASQGQESLEFVRRALVAKRPYPLAFVDVRMPPGWDGIETVGRLWELDPDLQVVFCTAYSDYSWDEMVARLGCTHRFTILKKPFDVIEVQQLANALTEEWHLMHQIRQHAVEMEQTVKLRTAELRESEQRYRMLFESMHNGFAHCRMLFDENGRPQDFIYLSVNGAFETLTGLKNAIGEKVTDVIPGIREIHPELFEIYGRVALTGQAERFELFFEPLQAWLSVSVSSSERETFIAVFDDITERKQAEAELAYERDLLRTLMENLPDSIYFKDRESRFLCCSKTQAERFGLKRMEDVLGKTDFDFFSEEHARPAFEDEQQIIRTGEPIVGKTEQEFWKADGSVTWALTTKMPLRNEKGEIAGTFGISRDITALKVAEQERQMIEVQLRQAHKLEAIGQLAAGIAHEINTPTQYVGDNVHFFKKAFAELDRVLTAHDQLVSWLKQQGPVPEPAMEILNGAARVQTDFLRREVPKAIADALEGVDRVNQIVRAMKEYSHPGAEEKQVVDLNRAIESTLTVSRNEWKYVAEMVTQFAPDLPPVPCLPGEFNQVILNLVVNAAHAIADVVGDGTSGNGTITVSTQACGDWAEIRVQDTGAGIPASIQHRIFEPFFTTKPVGKGSGQGLALSRSVIVDRHGGTIHFETEAGKGTTFIIRLPLKETAKEQGELT